MPKTKKEKLYEEAIGCLDQANECLGKVADAAIEGKDSQLGTSVLEVRLALGEIHKYVHKAYVTAALEAVELEKK